MLFLSSFPPRECGIATFTKDVVDSYDEEFGTCSATVAIDEPGGETRRYPDQVVARLTQHDRDSYATIADFVNAYPCDALSIQHEYGLFGGEEGEWIVDLITRVRKPVVTSLHTVLPEPSPTHLRVARALCAASSAVVVLSETGRDILVARYGVDPAKIRVIHHGVPDVPFLETAPAKRALGFEGRTTISTFGLISRGKGLEYAIEAMNAVVTQHPEALYLILGQTHPVVRRHEGESYRRQLEAEIARNHLADNVKLVDKYLDFDELIAYLTATDVYLTPYLNPTQIVSGTLAYAVGLGKAVVSTPYLYAEELLAHGRGFLTPFRDADAIATTLVALLDDPSLREATRRRAYRFGRRMTWPHVADAYGRLFTDLLPLRRREELATSA
ncbi:MAG: polysaccharide biosynthesis protein PslF [Candidatus Eremiobacteraeota bacterium]|jgi:glycosyltransferase involved in cell wall biosynthesis|nr:polysaccharide biosynthesis protein PslF [Candidatus Eremiobacteraeota bacterium]